MRATHAFVAAGIALTVVLVIAAIDPAAGRLFPGRLRHALAHVLVFALFAFVWARGLPRVPALVVAAAAAGFGVLHEGYEIVGHRHGFEFADALANATGAVCGVAFARLRRTNAR
ncbi:MAG TPA: hypothetical protein VKE95_12450 [Burkholderiales bacterium]|nr:hypothetical protein [Burkholderiales bacterium]